MNGIAHLARRVLATLRHTAQNLGRPDALRFMPVQGVGMWLPRAHTLPLFAKIYPQYGQNLVLLAALLGTETPSRRLRIIDIGANIGDSAKQVCAATPSDVLCIEGDPKWIPLLELNLDSSSWVVEPCFVDVANVKRSKIVHAGGTSQLVPSGREPSDLLFETIGDILHRHPEFADADLVKSDTDGYDCAIITELIRVGFCEDAVLFFEYDPAMTLEVGNEAASLIWPRLASAGYDEVRIWDNFGNYLGAQSMSDVVQMSSGLEEPRTTRKYDYWDVAVLKKAHGTLKNQLDVAHASKAVQ